MEENECLVENKSEKLLLQNIKFLRNNNNFLDVTLMCEDGVVISAHKLILASHSEKFKQIFSQMSSSSSPFMTPCIYLTGVSGTVLSNLVDYLYTGEAKVTQSSLADFLKVGQKFKVNSLVEECPSPSASKLVRTPEKPQSSVHPTSIQPSLKSPVIISVKQTNNKFDQNVNVKEEESENLLDDDNQDEKTIIDDDHHAVDIDDEDEEMCFEDMTDNFDQDDDDNDEDRDYEDCYTPKKSKTPKSKKSSSSPSPMKKDSADLDTNDSKVLIENLKSLGLHKLSKEQIKDTKSRKIVKMVMSRPLEKLPCPVEYMSEKQIRPWLMNEVLKDIIEQGKRPLLFVKWGHESCHPSFWPDEIWPWYLVTNPCHSYKYKPENVNSVETFKIAVRNRLRSKNKDPDTYVKDDYDETEVRNKMRSRGITNKQK